MTKSKQTNQKLLLDLFDQIMLAEVKSDLELIRMIKHQLKTTNFDPFQLERDQLIQLCVAVELNIIEELKS